MAGFTLTELMVAVAILAGMMAMVAMIFTSATEASRTAQGSAATYRNLQQAAETIRRDLEKMDPATAVLGIAGSVSSAPETDAPNAPVNQRRTDVLMLLTEREFEPYIYLWEDGFAQKKLVVYGHANFGRLDANGNWVGTPRSVEGAPSSIPASRRHLARRIIGFPNSAALLTSTDFTAIGQMTGPSFTGNVNNLVEFADVFRMSASAVLDVIPKGEFHYGTGGQEQYFVRHDGRPYRIEGLEKYVLSGGFWHSHLGPPADPSDPPCLGAPGDVWERVDPVDTHRVCEPDVPDPGALGLPSFPADWFYNGPGSRSVIDPSPPPGMSRRLAHYFLPGCSEFKVEFTYDNPREIALNQVGDAPLLFDRDGQDVPTPRPIRWQTVGNGEVRVWSGLSVNPKDYTTLGDLRDLTHPYRWPRGIRITIRSYGPRGGLERPIEQTIVHVWQ